MAHSDIPAKANRVLHVILVAFLLILVRVWYLCVVEYEAYLERSKKHQKKIIIEKPLRGTIRDRFNIPLAVNRIQYDAAICYDPIREIPSVQKSKNAQGVYCKIYPRREYIQTLSALLAKKLQLDPLDIEDTFYSKAALFPTTPFILKENVSEQLYYELKALERQFHGICTMQSAKRFYPCEQTAADILGYLGSINENEYFRIMAEMQTLKHYLRAYEEGVLIFLPKGFSNTHDIKERVRYLNTQLARWTDLSGKAGIEATFDDVLRGHLGKKPVEVSTKGSIVRELHGAKKAQNGQRVLLNISKELQEFAEALLAENEQIRDERFPQAGKDHHHLAPPWIKGGAIVAMIPTTGEIVAMASYPRMNGNDFLSKGTSEKALQWLENKKHIANLWNGKVPLEKELYSLTTQTFYKEERKLSLEHFIERVLSLDGHTKKAFQKLSSLDLAFTFQNNLYALLDLSEQPYMHALIDALYNKGHHPSCFHTKDTQLQLILTALAHHEPLVKELKPFLDKLLIDIPYNDDKILLLDLVRLVADAKRFDPSLISIVGADSLSSYRKLTQALSIIRENLLKEIRQCFHIHDFKVWRQENFKTYLQKKRKEEKEQGICPKPYLDYLKALEKQHFQTFWASYQWPLVALVLVAEPSDILDEYPQLKPYAQHLLSCEFRSSPAFVSSMELLKNRLQYLACSEALAYLHTMRSYDDLSYPLFGYYPQIRKKPGAQIEQDLAAAFYPQQGYGYGRSYAFRQSAPLGSIFKIVTAYEAIRQNHEKGLYANKQDLNPLTIIDEFQASTKATKEDILGFHEDGSKITRHYKGGRLPRTRISLGKIDYIQAFERSSNIYFSLLASDIIEKPSDLVSASLKFGFGNKTGVELPGEIPGILPKDLNENKSGLYAFAIGHHSLISTPLQTAVMLSSLVNDGEILKPQIVHLTAGIKNNTSALHETKNYSYQNALNDIGIFFPFFISTQPEQKTSDIRLFEKTCYRKLFLPPHIKAYLLQGLHHVISSPTGSARANRIRYLYQHPSAMRNYMNLKYQLAGKSSSAEIAYKPSLDRECPPVLCKDIWFGGISFKEPPLHSPITKQVEEIPELVVVVYLKFGDFGKEAAPLATEVITKWRELCKNYGKASFVN